MIFSFKRCISSLLCAAVLAGIVPGTVSASDEMTAENLFSDEEIIEIPSETENSGTVLSVLQPVVRIENNPLYEHLLPSVEEDIHVLPADPLYADGSSDVDLSEYHTEAEDAWKEIRSEYAARVEEIQVKYRIPVPETSEDVAAAARTLWYDALEHTGEPQEGDTMRWQYGTLSYGSLGGVISGTYAYLTFTYTPEYYTTAEQEAAVDAAVEELLTEELNLDGLTDYEVVKAVYDWICANVTYDHDNLNDDSYRLKHTAYAALIPKTCVCQGYALLMYRLLLENDIDCRLIAGDGGGPHAWNIVELDNFYYNVDATWDAGKSPENYEWFLLNQESFVDHVRYNDEEKHTMYDSPEFHAAYPMAEENYFSDDEIRTEGILDEESNITWTLSMDGTLTISGEGDMPGFAQDTDDGRIQISTEFLPWKNLLRQITRIVVSPGITAIGDGAFYGSAEAVSVEIANTVTEIGLWAFANCTSLNEIRIPATVTSIGYQAFGNCTSLNEILFSGRTTPSIDDSAFTGVTATAYYPAKLTVWTGNVRQNYGGSLTWTELNSMEISTAEELYIFAELVNGGHIYLDAFLRNDITVNENVLNEEGFIDTEDMDNFRVWTPIGTSANYYLGIFDGGGNTVSGLYFYDSTVSDVGFFGQMGLSQSGSYYGMIKNLTIEDSYFNGSSCVGGIVGTNGGGTIQNCLNHSTIISSGSAGGITGYSDGPLLDCVNTGIVRGKAGVGGIAGQIVDSDITRCTNSGEVTSFKGAVGSGISVGGIVGLKAQSGTISYCTNLGAITGVTDVGGIAGTHERDRVINCLNSGSVTGTSSVGGISGYLRSGSVQNCFDNGTGSIFGSCPSGTLSSCYYFADSETDSQSGITAVNLKQCRSGEVAFLLGSAWGQIIGKEDFPVLNGMKVYKTTEDSPCPGYTNNADGIKEHEYEDGFCKWCGAPEFTADNYDVNGDGEITTDDVLYLLRYTILPGRYPLASGFDADFDGDGFVTAKDAVSLMNSIGSTETP